MKHTEDYNIHNIARIQIETDNRNILKWLNYPLDYFRTSDHICNPDISVYIGEFKSKNFRCDIVENNYHFTNNYMHIINNESEMKWEAEIIGIENSPIRINFNGRIKNLKQLLAPDVLVQDQILIPMIELFMERRDIYFGHGGGFVHNNNGILLFGRCGSFKTSILMQAVRKGFKILGDEKLLLDINDGRAFCFPIWRKNFEYCIGNKQNERLNFYDRIRLAIPLLINEQDIEVWQQSSTLVKKIFLLKKRRGISDIRIDKISIDVAIQEIISDKKADLYDSSIFNAYRRFPFIMDAYCLSNPRSILGNHWSRLSEKLKNAFRSLLIYEIEIPYHNGIDRINEVFERIMEENDDIAYHEMERYHRR